MHTLIIDARNLLWRAAQANADLFIKIEGKRVHTGGVYGFLMSLLAVHERYGGRVVIAWEGKNNFRFKLFPGYKSKRAKPEKEDWLTSLNAQQRRLTRILSFAGVAQYWGEGCEADDVIATLATQANGPVLIYTMDSDLRQLVDERVKVISAGYGGDKVYDRKLVRERHGVKPTRLPDLKAIAGDPGDSIPGARGIGEKTALQLLKSYGTLGGVIKAARADDPEWPVHARFKKVVADSRAQLRIFKKCTTVLIDAHLYEIPATLSKNKLRARLMKYGFRTLSHPERMTAVLALAG